MTEASKTVAFVITAGILAVAAFFTWYQTQPADVVGFEKVGQEFFPQFQDATAATSLEVTAYDAGTDGLQEFSVRLEDGLWRIPSHHGYPAEAAERLARTATSVIGLTRESIVARRNNKHGEFAVVDPADNEADPETAGQRITLKNENGDVLADYIIGKPAGRAAEENPAMVREVGQQDEFFYVRVPDEKETYKARVQVNLSTRFSDWINPDLLKLEAADVNRLEIDNYELKEETVQVGAGQVQPQFKKNVIDRQKLTRDGFAPWQLDGINPQTEELDTLPVESILTLLDSMKIVGVRPKLKLNGELLVKSDLSINEELARQNPQLFQKAVYQLQVDLERKGFTIGTADNSPGQITLLGSRGELRAATNEGVLYTLYFGRSVSGDTKEIEIGAAIDDSESGSDDAEKTDPGSATETSDTNVAEAGAEESPGEESSAENESETEEAGENKSRYVAIRVDFDATALGEKPVPPTEPTRPEKPEGYDEWKKAREAKMEELGNDVPPEERADEEGDGENAGESADPATEEESGGDQNETESDKQEDEQDDSPEVPADIAAVSDEKFREYEKALEEHEQARIQYTTDLEMYESKKFEYEAREKNGKELIADLNERFAEWFYVVPAESLASLKLTRGDLIKVKETPPPNPNAPPAPGEMGNQLPPAPDIDFKSDDKKEPESSSDDPKASDEKGKDDNTAESDNSKSESDESESDESNTDKKDNDKKDNDKKDNDKKDNDKKDNDKKDNDKKDNDKKDNDKKGDDEKDNDQKDNDEKDNDKKDDDEKGEG